METNQIKKDSINVNAVYLVLMAQIVVCLIFLVTALPVLPYTIFVFVRVCTLINHPVYSESEKKRQMTSYLKKLFSLKKLTYILLAIVMLFTGGWYVIMGLIILSRGIVLIVLIPEICLYFAFKRTIKNLQHIPQVNHKVC